MLFQNSSGGGSPFWGDAVADFASLPVAGDVVGQIRQTLDTGYLYKWNGASWDLYFDGGFVDPMTTDGDLITQAGGVPARIGIGANGTVLTSNGTAASWQPVTGTGDVVGPASATDEAVARFNLATGKLIQNSVVLIDDVGVVSGITQLNVDNLRLDGNTLSSTNVNGNIIIAPNGTGNVVTDRIQTSGSSGVALYNSGGTLVADFGTANTTNATLVGVTNIDDLQINANALVSTGTNANVVIDPNGTGFVAVESDLRLPEIATPATPATGYGKVYFKSDGNLYQLNDAGVETNLANATGVSNTNFVAYTSPGYGSTATRIFRFTTVEVNNLGGNVTYTSSSVNGDSWTINVEGLYTFTFIFESSDSAREAGITLNQSNLTLNITANPESEQLVSGCCIASRRTPMSVTRWLTAGDVIRACGDGGTVVTGTGDHRFCINKIG